MRARWLMRSAAAHPAGARTTAVYPWRPPGHVDHDKDGDTGVFFCFYAGKRETIVVMFVAKVPNLTLADQSGLASR